MKLREDCLEEEGDIDIYIDIAIYICIYNHRAERQRRLKF